MYDSFDKVLSIQNVVVFYHEIKAYHNFIKNTKVFLIDDLKN
jgi:hypothetical protein